MEEVRSRGKGKEVRSRGEGGEVPAFSEYLQRQPAAVERTSPLQLVLDELEQRLRREARGGAVVLH